jgi:hypothetical protein
VLTGPEPAWTEVRLFIPQGPPASLPSDT